MDKFPFYQFLILIGILIINTQISAQVVERKEVAINRMDGTAYLFPGVGGMNNPQFSEVDYNNDGIMDLFVFDKTGDVPLTYINNGTANEVDYVFAPEYASIFPRTMKEWALLRDYNNDGVMDIFCYSSTPGYAGIDLYKGTYDATDGLSYELVLNHHNDVDLLSFPNSNGLELEIYVNRDDLPSILDVDNDGDIDILTFSQVSGSKMEWYKNLSVEMGYGVDSLYFDFVDECWGLFIESGTSSDITVSDNENQCADLNGFTANTGIHVGSTSVCWDNDGDGDMELIVGDITTNSLTYLNSNTVNDGASPWLDIKEDNFPSYDTSVDIPLFPAPFILDVNNDGRKDFIAAPNDVGASLNRNVVWMYENYASSGEGQFSFRQDDFLVENCVDLGQGSKPAFFDYNADGLMDVVVGTDGFFVNLAEFDTRLVLFKNIGTAMNPVYQIEDEDWLGFSEYNDRNLAPAFGDLDGDGDQDLLVGENGGSMFYVENEGGDGTPVFNQIIPAYLSIEGGQKCVPAIADLDKDGLADIITGVKQGRLSFFKNIGTVGTPNFNPDAGMSPNIDGLGGVDVRFYYDNGVADTRGYAAPKVFYVNGTDPHIITGSYFNNIFVYNMITDDLTTAFVADADNYGEIYEGQETAMDMADIDGDGYFEMVVGNFRGGIGFYETDYPSDFADSNEETLTETLDYEIIPNPAHDKIEIIVDGLINTEDIRMGIMDVTGKWVKDMKKGSSIEIGDLPVGIFIVVSYLGDEKVIEKIVKY